MRGPLVKNPERVPVTLQVAAPAATPQPESIPVGVLTEMAKISKTGTYKDKDGNYYIGKAGDQLPEGWEYAGPLDSTDDEEGAPADVVVDERSKGAAPENKAAKAAPENR